MVTDGVWVIPFHRLSWMSGQTRGKYGPEKILPSQDRWSLNKVEKTGPGKVKKKRGQGPYSVPLRGNSLGLRL